MVRTITGAHRWRDFTGTYDQYIALGENPGEESIIIKEEKAAYELTQKEQYQQRKAETARIRQMERRLEAIAKEVTKLESELVDIEDELFGDAATDYLRAGELSDRKITVEDRLMQLYEEEETIKAELDEK